MNPRPDPDRLVHAFLLEGEEQPSDPVYDAVRAEIEQTRQRAGIGLWRSPTMNKFVTIGLGAAAVVLALLVGTQLLGSPSNNLGGPGGEPTPTPEPTATSEPSAAEPTRTPWVGLPEGPFVISDTRCASLRHRVVGLDLIAGSRRRVEGRRRLGPAGIGRRRVARMGMASPDRLQRVRRSLSVDHDHPGDACDHP